MNYVNNDCEDCLYVCMYTEVYQLGSMQQIDPEACHFVASRSQANIIVVENAKQLDKILQGRAAVTEVCVDSLVPFMW